MAVADANDKFRVKLSYKWEEIDCDATQAMVAINRMRRDDIIDAVIGPDCESSCEGSGSLTAAEDLVQISYSCCSDLLSNKLKYPTVRPHFSVAHSRCFALADACCESMPMCASFSCCAFFPTLVAAMLIPA